MSMRQTASAMRRQILTAVHRRPKPLPVGGPLYSFTFDDFPRTALTIGGRVLKLYGAHGTYYTAPALMGKTTEVGEQFGRGDLDELVQEGHELASHTYSHISCRLMPATRYREEVRRGQASIGSLTGLQGPHSFAFPFGDVTMRCKAAVGQIVSSARSVWDGVNAPTVDLNLLLANRLYGGDEAKPRVRALIQENEERGGWLIFVTHDVQSTPSRYGCKPDLLEYAVWLASRRGTIRTVTEVTSAISCEGEAVPN
jgi:peptidoglycan/xylan/chitin deacetylase (PgdA/CDA1 family)